MGKNILIAGESWVKHITHMKGFDMFTSIEYETGVKWLKEAAESGGFEVTHMPGHEVPDNFPFTKEELNKYAAVVLSDIGANSLLLSGDCFLRGRVTADRCKVIADYVSEGGAFAMIGGYMSFSGIDAKARYGVTAIGDILPVAILNVDDRVEVPQGVTPRTVNESHPIMSGLGEWPHFLGYNKTVIKTESSVELLSTAGGDPFVAVREYGKGRTGIFASDAAPHWGPVEFLEWRGYKKFWAQFFKWLVKEQNGK